MLELLFVVFGFVIGPSLAHAEVDSQVDSKFWIEAEAGQVWQTRNDVQVPATTGTRYSLTDLGKGPALAGRIYLGYRISASHEIRALYAPLTLNLNGSFASPVTFEGTTFVSGVPTDAKYQFNSYRLTYRYVFRNDEKWTMRFGFTGKIRDAKIQLTQGAQTAATTNVGFVPLLHFSALYHLTSEYKFHFDADALAAPQGRAEDVALLMGFRPTSRTEYRVGYRTVEGGADGTGGVYTFAWLHYAIVGLHHDF